MKRILVVEDNEANLYLVRFLLEKTGYEVIEAKTGKNAVDVFHKMQPSPDLVIMDIQLPDMNGLDVTRIIRSMREDIPIIALTSFAMPGDRDNAVNAGCSGYIQKPIDPDTFITEIECHLGEHR